VSAHNPKEDEVAYGGKRHHLGRQNKGSGDGAMTGLLKD
jgi:hypothetical protein